jgi:ABC-type nitrate/sulfonate/bicarbonate transport system permease component
MATADASELPGYLRRRLPGAITIVALLAGWQLISWTLLAEAHLLPGPIEIVEGIAHDWPFYPRNIAATMSVAARGFLFGNLIAVVLAFVCILLPRTEGPIMQLAVVAYAVPILSIAPILVVLFEGDRARVILSALAVFFTTLVGTHAGLQQADLTSLDVVKAYGGGRYAQLVKVRLWTCLPYLFAALRIATPTAILGAIIAEFLGADRGLGIALVVSEQNLNTARTLGIGAVAATIAGVAYWIVGLIGSRLAPWAPASRGAR